MSETLALLSVDILYRCGSGISEGIASRGFLAARQLCITLKEVLAQGGPD
jgi:hypothetical protein